MSLSQEVDDILGECHDRMVGGHLALRELPIKFGLLDYGGQPLIRIWLTRYICDICQILKQTHKSYHMELHVVLSQSPFEKLGHDYTNQFKPTTHNNQVYYIVVTTNYFTKWIEA